MLVLIVKIILKKNGFEVKSWEYLNNKCEIRDSIFIEPINRLEIIQHINKIKDNTSFYENGLTNYILKQTANTISYPLAYIFNLSIVLGSYPTVYKKCVISPLYKSGNTSDCSNYRPIALSLTVSKLFEKCIKSRLLLF